MSAELSAEQRAAVEAVNGDRRADGLAPADALATSRVDLIELIRTGIPERSYVPGGEPLLLAGKRYLIPAPAGTGKSLLTVVLGIDVVAAGGTVVILDVENGAEEYARRLSDVLEARDVDGSLADACTERLRYHAWPALRVSWGAEEWAAAFAGVDLAAFDSSRLMLSAAGLGEDSNDDYSAFVHALLIPLARAGVTTLVLDNTGHEERDRARGASAKGDLNEVVYTAKVGEEFGRDQAGHLRLVRRRTRFTELPGELHVPLGGGVYGPIEEAEAGADSDGFRPTALMERASKAIEESPGLARKDVLALVGGKTQYASLALGLLVAEDYVRVERDGHSKLHFSAQVYREIADPRAGTPWEAVPGLDGADSDEDSQAVPEAGNAQTRIPMGKTGDEGSGSQAVPKQFPTSGEEEVPSSPPYKGGTGNGFTGSCSSHPEPVPGCRYCEEAPT
jgi:hypothetical protein